MGQTEKSTVKLKVSPQVAKIVGQGAPRDAQLSAARGALPLSGKDLLTVLFFFCNGKDPELKKAAIVTLKELPAALLQPVLADPGLHPQLFDLVVRARLADAELMGAVIMHPGVRKQTLLHLAGKAGQSVLERLAGHQKQLADNPELVEAIIANPNAERALKFRLGWVDPEEAKAAAKETEAATVGEASDENESAEELTDEELAEVVEEKEKEGLSKYQLCLELKVAEKIKLGLTGDKEWRSLLVKDSNKLVQAAVMRNPRMTDGEALHVASNKASTDEHIRLILLNRDWMKLYSIKKALIFHPRTPVAKAIRLIQFLTTKDLKELARSKNVVTAIVTSARKELENKMKRGM